MRRTYFLTMALLSSAVYSAAAQASEYTLGDVMYVGDSITHGVDAPSYRWAMHKILVDNGITYDEVGYRTGNYSGGITAGTTYGGVTFENVHSSQASARAWELAGRKAGGRFDDTNIKNWLGQSSVKTNGSTYTGPTFTGEDAPETFLLLIGTNDLLSDGGGINNSANLTSKTNALLGTDLKSGDMGTIVDAMYKAAPDAAVYISTIPCWTMHDNSNDASYHTAARDYNESLKSWVSNYNAANKTSICLMEVNRGIIDVASDTPFYGVRDMYNSKASDGLHPNKQGDLIMAGNYAQAMGLAGRTAGQERRSAESFALNITADATADAVLTNVTTADGALDFSGEGASSVIVSWENAGAYNGGFTVELGDWQVGNGAEGGWDTADALSVTIGNGSLYGTLSIDEAYIKWGNTILFSEDMSAIGSSENLRVAYLAGSAGEGVSSGFYVWLNDMLIGEALGATGGSEYNGITLTYGGSGCVTLGSISAEASASLAPSTTSATNSENAFLAKFITPRPAAAAQGTVVLPSEYDISETVEVSEFKDGDAVASAISGTTTQNSDRISITADIGTSTVNAFGNKTSRSGEFYITFSNGKSSSFSAAHGTALYQNVPAGVNIDGNILLRLSGSYGGANSMFGIANAGSVSGDVTLVFDAGNAAFDNISQGAPASVAGAYQGSIGGTFKAVINCGTFNSNILGGVHSGSSNSIGRTRLYINGGNIGGNVYGGGRTGTIGSLRARSIEPASLVTITNGIIEKDVYGGGSGGIINGDTKVVLTGGTVMGSVYGGGSGGTINGNTSVTIDGNLTAVYGSTISGGGSGGTVNGNSTVTIMNASASDYEGTIDKFTGTVSGGSRSVVQGTRTLVIENSTLRGTDFDSAAIADFDAITLSNSEITLSSLGGAGMVELKNSSLSVSGDVSSLRAITMDLESNLTLADINNTAEDAFYIYLTDSGSDLSKLSITLTGVDYADGAELSNVYIQAGGTTYHAEIAWLDKQSSIRNLSVGTAVPEPTTATLGLLALSVLAARRRRR